MTEARSARPTRQFQLALYAIGVFILVDQGSQLLVGIVPFHPDRANWRFASFSLATGYLSTFLLADMLLIAAASGLGHRRFLRGWSVLHLIKALALAALIPLFLLDMAEMRAMVQAQFQRTIVATAGRTAASAVLAVIVLAFIGIFLWRTTRKPADTRTGPLLVERP
jgi:hypothetical protein